MKLNIDQFMHRGKLFQRVPGGSLFLAVNKLIKVPCPFGDNHSHFAALGIDEEDIPKLLMREINDNSRTN